MTASPFGVLVTGGAGGLGGAIVSAFAERGDAVVSVDSVAHDHGGGVLSMQCDVTDPLALARLEEQLAADGHRVDILVNAAGVASESRFLDMTAAEFDRVFHTNVAAAVEPTRVFLPGMVRHGWGRVIMITSQLGQRGEPGFAHYAASKAAIVGFSKSLAREVAESGVTVNCVAPGPVNTPMSRSLPDAATDAIRARLPLGRFAEIHEVVPTVLLLAGADSGSAYIGQTLGPNSGDVMP
ncbi:SDR family NAD(P)-dependent oxidoreductase [Planococcus sp. APC 4015]|nr:SDR family NAD(P)-dependent oxidoreductase [Planococcus sp. APC 4015]